MGAEVVYNMQNLTWYPSYTMELYLNLAMKKLFPQYLWKHLKYSGEFISEELEKETDT